MQKTENKGHDFWIMVIPFGEANAIHQKPLADRLGMTCDRLKAEIRAARKNGVEICSTHNGYFFPKDEAERRRFVDMQTKQAICRFATSKTARKTLQEFEGQMAIGDIGSGGANNGETETK